MADQCNKQSKWTHHSSGTVSPMSIPLNTLGCQTFSHLVSELSTVHIFCICFPGPAISTEFSRRQNKNNAQALQGREMFDMDSVQDVGCVGVRRWGANTVWVEADIYELCVYVTFL